MLSQSQTTLKTYTELYNSSLELQKALTLKSDLSELKYSQIFFTIESKERQINVLESNAIVLSKELRKSERVWRRKKTLTGIGCLFGGIALGFIVSSLSR